MIICSCMCLSEEDVRQELLNFGESLAGKACGTCYPTVEQIIEQINIQENKISLDDPTTKDKQ